MWSLKIRLSVVIIVAILTCATMSIECDDKMKRANCLDCNEDNYCVKCTKGYYVEKAIGSETGGHCIHCPDKCLDCDSKDRCSECVKGYLAFNEKCWPCELGCSACQGLPTNCTTCAEHYILDTKGECYFRYTVIAMLCGTVALYLIMFTFCFCMNAMRKHQQSSNGKREHSESILGDEFKSYPSLISDVTQIGKYAEQDKDLSLVMDSHDNGQNPVMEESIREDEEMFNESAESPEKKDPVKLRHFGKKNKK